MASRGALIVLAPFLLLSALLSACGGSDSNNPPSPGPQCDSVAGSWSVGASPNEVGSNATCTAILAGMGGHASHAFPFIATTSGNTVTIAVKSASLTGTLDPTACTLPVILEEGGGSLVIGGAHVEFVGTSRLDITFNTNSSLTALWTTTIHTATGMTGLPCTITGSVAGTKT